MHEKSAKEFRQGLGRARTLMRQAFGHWPGSPLLSAETPQIVKQIEWCSWSAAGPCTRILIYGLRLREMEQTLKCLALQYRPHLEKELPDAADWLERTSNCLELVKEFLVKQPSERPTWSQTIQRLALSSRWKQKTLELAERQPELKELLWRLSFYELTSFETHHHSRMLWVETHAEALKTAIQFPSGLDFAMVLARLGDQVDPRWLQVLFDLWSNQSLRDSPIESGFALADDLAYTLRQRLNGNDVQQPSARDGISLAGELMIHVWSLAASKPTALRTGTRLFGALVGRELPGQLAGVRAEALREEKRLQSELARLRHMGHEDYMEAIGRNQALHRAVVHSTVRDEALTLTMLFSTVQSLCSRSEGCSSAESVTLLAEFFDLGEPLGITDRLRLIASCSHDCLNRWLKPLIELVKRRGWRDQSGQEWMRRCGRGVSASKVLSDLFNMAAQVADQPGWGRAIQLFEFIAYDSEEVLDDATAFAIVKLAQVTPTLASALEHARKVPAQVFASASVEALRQAAWAVQDPREFRFLLAWLGARAGLAEQIAQVRATIREPEHEALLRRLVLAHDTQAVLRWSECVALLESFNKAYPPTQEDQFTETADQTSCPSWIEQYPALFRDCMISSLILGEKSERVVYSVLREQYPRAADMARELSALKCKLADEAWCQEQTAERVRRMRQRCANLAQLLAAPLPVSAEQQSRLVEKLRARIDQEMLDDIVLAAHNRLLERLDLLNIDELQERLRCPPYNGILSAIGDLSREQQQLAWRALGHGWTSTLNLLNEPANQAFIERMQARGICLDAWFSSEFGMDGVRGDGTPYRIAFTRDPLDILLMGQHFATCLALDGCNFYSTVSNLVDANKRVLYGKTDTGKVVGRCLFVLTGQGKLQTFNRYSFTVEDKFDQLVEQFAQQLVQAMGTEQTDTGHVPCLVASEWYNDGCVAMPDSLKAKSAALRQAIRDQPQADAYALAMTIFRSMDEMIQAVPFMYEEGVFYELASMRSFFPYLVHQTQVPLSMRLRMAGHIYFEGQHEQARAVFDRLNDRELIRSVGRHALQDLMYDRGFVDMIIDRNPRLARRLLRRSRPSYVRADEHELNDVRVHARDRIAEALLRQTVRRTSSPSSSRSTKQRRP